MQKHKLIRARKLTLTNLADRDKIDQNMDALLPHGVNEVCWNVLNEIPHVKFSIAYTPDLLLIKFYVCETSHKAVYTEANDPVFKDSCVEFFIAVDEHENYYNFEFNSLGTCLASYGKNRYNRLKLDPALIDRIGRWVSWEENQPALSLYKWQLTVTIPISVFGFSDLHLFKSANQYKVNFYKCGDELKEPHYLAWNPVLSPTADFHQSRYFGALALV